MREYRLGPIARVLLSLTILGATWAYARAPASVSDPGASRDVPRATEAVRTPRPRWTRPPVTCFCTPDPEVWLEQGLEEDPDYENEGDQQ